MAVIRLLQAAAPVKDVALLELEDLLRTGLLLGAGHDLRREQLRHHGIDLSNIQDMDKETGTLLKLTCLASAVF